MSGEQYVPTTETVRSVYASLPLSGSDREGLRRKVFDRWLAAHDAEVRALPDREVVAITIAGARGHTWIGPDDREVADAVLALFGQEADR